MVCQLERVFFNQKCVECLFLTDHCMMSFVKPSLLGTRKEFTNSFANPIQNGQCADSTPVDFSMMKQRSHVLFKMLEGCVQVSLNWEHLL